MKSFLLDLNVWLALSVKGHAHHQPAAAWLNAEKGTSRIILTRATQSGLLRLLTTEQIMAPYGRSAHSNDEAWRIVTAWTQLDYVDFEPEPLKLEDLWGLLASHQRPSPKLWNDAYLAAFAQRSGHRLVTFDTAFRQFKGVDLLLLG